MQFKDRLPVNSEIEERYAIIKEIELAIDTQSQVSGRDHHIVMLDHNVISEVTGARLLDTALIAAVLHFDVELQAISDVINAMVGFVLRVDLSVEEPAGPDPGHHLFGPTAHRHCRPITTLVFYHNNIATLF